MTYRADAGVIGGSLKCGALAHCGYDSKMVEVQATPRAGDSTMNGSHLGRVLSRLAKTLQPVRGDQNS